MGLMEGRGFSGDLEDALAAARNGEEQGFRELWRELQPAVLRYLHVIVGDAAQDLATQAWEQAAREIRQFQGNAAEFRIWLFRTARHRAWDELIWRGYSQNPGNSHATGTPPARVSTGRTGTGAGNLQATGRVLQLIAQLPTDQAEVIMLRIVAKLDNAQAATVLDISSQAAQTAATRGLETLAMIAHEQATRAAHQAHRYENGQTTKGNNR